MRAAHVCIDLFMRGCGVKKAGTCPLVGRIGNAGALTGGWVSQHTMRSYAR